jgi:hypothetical protein
MNDKQPAQESVLPYKDRKPVGAADFYYAINATFRYMHNKLGAEGLRSYWCDLGKQYYTPVRTLWKREGLRGVAQYWRDFFRAEPGGDVEVIEQSDRVEVNVKVCPAIKQLRAGNREILSCFCQHCYFVSDAVGEAANVTVRIQGGNGSCRQVFLKRDQAVAAQDLSKILEAR